MLRKQNFEQNKGEIILCPKYRKANDTIQHFQIINIGKSYATLNEISTTPKLSWKSNPNVNTDNFDITKLHDVFLAPNQCIPVSYDMGEDSNKQFSVSIKYTTLGKEQKHSYSVDLSLLKHAIDFDMKPNTITEAVIDLTSILESINQRQYLNGFH